MTKIGPDPDAPRVRVMNPAPVDPNAPLDEHVLPDFWDERRRREGKADLSRCARELRAARALRSAPVSTTQGYVISRTKDGKIKVLVGGQEWVPKESSATVAELAAPIDAAFERLRNNPLGDVDLLRTGPPAEVTRQDTELLERVDRLERRAEIADKRLADALGLINAALQNINAGDLEVQECFDTLRDGVTKGLLLISDRVGELERREAGRRPS